VVVWNSKEFRVDCVPYLEFYFCIQPIKGRVFFFFFFPGLVTGKIWEK